jgi:hypothetical protein
MRVPDKAIFPIFAILSVGIFALLWVQVGIGSAVIGSAFLLTFGVGAMIGSVYKHAARTGKK